MKKVTKTIALLCGEPRDLYSNEIVKGALCASKEYDVNLIVVPGKYYGNDLSDFEYRFEYQYTALYSFINSKNVDAAVILTGALGPFCDEPSARNYFKAFRSKFDGLPIVSVATEVEGWSLVKYDNKVAIKEGIEYLIKEQHCKHIAMVTGEPTSEDAIERLNAYKEALLEEDMPIDEKLIVYGNFTKRSKPKIRALIEQHPSIDAIVFANDKMAYAGYEVMEELGLVVGKDIAFLGFDDNADAVRKTPPLASIRADASDLGYEAVKLAINTSQFKTTKSMVLPTRLIVRESMQKEVNNKDLAEIFKGVEFDIDRDFFAKSIEIYEYLIEKRDYRIEHEKIMLRYVDICNALEKLLRARTLNDDDFDDFENSFIAFLEFCKGVNIDATKLIRIYDRVMKYMSDNKDDDASKIAISNVTARIFRRIAEQLDNSSETRHTQFKKLFRNSNSFTKEMFSFDSGSDQNFSQILAPLPRLGITNSFLVLFDKPITYLFTDKFKIPKKLNVKAVQHYDEVFVPSKRNQVVDLDDLFDYCYKLSEEMERKDYILLSLFVDEKNYGMIMCDMPYELYDCCDAIVNQGSNAVRMLNLLQQEYEIQEQLEQSLLLLQKNNIQLENLANKDSLTNIYNRRGFLDSAKLALEDKSNYDRYALIAYADTDNLKIINDRYGHEGGDFALTSCSSILSNVFGKKGIVGRIGGDEFAILCVVDKVEAQDEYQKALEKAVSNLNADSGKDYLVKMSIGMTLVKIKEGLDIADLLEKADALLYKKKKYRRKEIMKAEVEN